MFNMDSILLFGFRTLCGHSNIQILARILWSYLAFGRFADIAKSQETHSVFWVWYCRHSQIAILVRYNPRPANQPRWQNDSRPRQSTQQVLVWACGSRRESKRVASPYIFWKVYAQTSDRPPHGAAARTRFTPYEQKKTIRPVHLY